MLKDVNVIAFSLVKSSIENVVSSREEASRRRSPSGRDWFGLIPKNQELREIAMFKLGTCGNFHKFHRIFRMRHSERLPICLTAHVFACKSLGLSAHHCPGHRA